MNRKIVCVLIISLCSTVSVFSQKIFNGRIVDAETNAAIPHVYIENSSRNIISESNSNGYFDIFTHPGDTLLFSCIGYYWAKHIVTTENNQTFHLTPQIYDLGVVTKRFPYSYDELTNRVLSMKPTEDTLQLNLPHEKYQPVNNHQPGQLSYTITGAITDIYNATNRHARNAIRAAELLSKKENILIMNKKFNKDMVVAMTNVPDEYFESFIRFCNFSDEFLTQTSEFQIIMTICWQYERFLDIHPELKNSLN